MKLDSWNIAALFVFIIAIAAFMSVFAELSKRKSARALIIRVEQEPRKNDQVIIRGYEKANKLLQQGWVVKYTAGTRHNTYWLMEYSGE